MFNPPPLPPSFGQSIKCPFCALTNILIPSEQFYDHFNQHKKKFLTEACCEMYGYKLESPSIYLAHLCKMHPSLDFSHYFGEAIHCPFCKHSTLIKSNLAEHMNQEHAEQLKDIPKCRSDMTLLPEMSENYFECIGPCKTRFYKGGIHKLPLDQLQGNGVLKCLNC